MHDAVGFGGRWWWKAIDAIFKVSIIAAVALASVSVAYYYFVYLPARDARLDAEKQALEQRLDAESEPRSGVRTRRN